MRGQACRTAPAAAARVLYVGGMPPKLTPEATMEIIASLLSPVLRPAAAGEDGGGDDNHGGVGGGGGDLELELTDRGRLRQGIVGSGEIFLEFPTHADAVRAAYTLRGSELILGQPLVVGWATPEEWRQSRPRVPVYF